MSSGSDISDSDSDPYSAESENGVSVNIQSENPTECSSRDESNALQISWAGNYGIKPEIVGALIGQEPIEYFSLFLDNEIIQEMVDQTNLYATQVLTSGNEYQRLHSWIPTDINEMKKFLGVIGYMGLVRLPTKHHYWAKSKKLYASILPQVITKARFELLLKFWHFSDNEACPEGDRTYKVRPLLDSLLKRYQKVYTPGEYICIDEALRLVVKQCTQQKTHKVKLLKLSTDKGYTWNVKMYVGRDTGASVPTQVVITLANDLLESGRTIVTNNYYTSLKLANLLLDKKTHLIGTIRSNKRGIPRAVITKKLKRGEMIAKVNSRGICIMKWRDKRHVLLLSTKHTNKTVTIMHRKKGNIDVPEAVVEYNSAKSSIDLSDQIATHNTALRRTIKWYRKIAIELIWGTSVVNAHILCKKITNNNLRIDEFREKIIEALLFPSHQQQTEEPETHGPLCKRKRLNTHAFCKKEGNAHKMRKYCKGCYEKKRKGLIGKNNVCKVVTYCQDCEGQPHYCLNCFNAEHT